MRYFRTDDAEAYDAARLTLDAAWGHTPPTTCITPAAGAPRDSAGRIVLAVNDEFCEYEAAKQMLELMLGSGAVIEIQHDEYMAAVKFSPG